MTTDEWIHVATIPIFTAVIGWLINWTGVMMLFAPTQFHGFHVPGLKLMARSFPEKLQEIPGIQIGGIGWQGIVPARAGKMGSLAVDNAISKLGTPREFYAQLEPQKIAQQILDVYEPEMPRIIDQIMEAEHPNLWRDLPATGRRAVTARVLQQLPKIVNTVTDQIGEHIDQLLSPKLMVINRFRQDPSVVVKIFREFGARELRMMVNFGFIFGFALGIPVAALDHVFGVWWLLPVLGVLVGWVTNALGMWLIFEPADPKRILGIRFHGLFPRRQDEAAEVYGRIIAEDVITLENIGEYLMFGPCSDRTRQMLADALRPAIDEAAGPLRGAVRIVLGSERFDRIREAIAKEAVDRTLLPFQDPAFSKQQSANIRRLISERCKQLPAPQFVDMMRAAIKEDEWLLYAHGAIMGFAGGMLHLWIFGVGGA